MSSSLPRRLETAPIVRAESLAAWRDGERHLEQARQEAETLRQAARTQADALLAQARQAGYDEGRRAAMNEAAELALRLAAERESYLRDLEPRLVRVIDAAVRKILDGLEDADLVAGAARKAVGELRESGRFTLRAAPGMTERVGEHAMQRLAGVLTLREDETLRGSQCFLETATGIIELTPHAQWEHILKALQADSAERT